MLQLAARQLLARRLASGLGVAALASALVGALAIVSVSARATARLQGGVEQAWRSPFDLLVRPVGAASESERDEDLVRPNYLTGVIGGITDGQVREIRSIAGIEVAAPVAMVGFVDWPGELTVDPYSLVGKRPYALLRLRVRTRADVGMSLFPRAIRPEYLLVAPHGTVVDRFSGAPGGVGEFLRAGGKRFRCATPDGLPSAGRPRCLAPRLTIISPQGTQHYPTGDAFPERQQVSIPFRLPLLLAGVDPTAESRISGLERCRTSGAYLRSAPLHEHVVQNPLYALGVGQLSGNWDSIAVTDIPLLASERSFLDESVEMIVEGADARAPVARRTWRSVWHHSQTAERIYRRSLGKIGRRLLATGTLVAAGDVRYQTLAPSRLQALPQPPLFSAFDNPVFGEQGTGRIYAPVEAHDTWLRRLSGRQLQLDQVASSRFRLSGTYDPTCLRGFDPLAGARLDVAAPPEVSLPDGRVLLPSRSPAGYVTPPPLMLTTLEGARFFADPRMYSGAPGSAYISAVRVRVSGVSSLGNASRHRLERVALAIHERTGLRVDVVKGASTRDVSVALPAGRFGRPPLSVRERWSVKGVALRFNEAISVQNLTLVIVTLCSAGLLMGQAAYVAVRRRQAEFAALRAMGWRRRDLAALVTSENLLIGLVAGAVATAVGLAAVAASGAVSPALAFVAFPAAIALAMVAGLVPALQAGRGSVTERFTYQPRPQLSRPPRTAAGVGMRAVRLGWRGEALVAVIALAVGAASVGAVVLVAAGFEGRLDATVLGRHLAAEAGRAQTAAAVLTALLAAGVGTQVILLSYLERRKELSCLRALGWPRRSVSAFVAGQGIALSSLAAGVAGLAVAAAGAVVGTSVDALAIAVAATVAVAAVTGATMIAVPVVLVRGELVDTLREG
jgi:putative ABC transport system permease protein